MRSAQHVSVHGGTIIRELHVGAAVISLIGFLTVLYIWVHWLDNKAFDIIDARYNREDLLFFFKYFADRASQYIYLLISTNLMH